MSNMRGITGIGYRCGACDPRNGKPAHEFCINQVAVVPNRVTHYNQKDRKHEWEFKCRCGCGVSTSQEPRGIDPWRTPLDESQVEMLRREGF